MTRRSKTRLNLQQQFLACVAFCAFFCTHFGVCAAQTELLSDEGVQFFENRIRPVLVRECYGCHSTKAARSQGGLKVDTKMALQLGGDSGPAVVPGSLEDSLLWLAIQPDDHSMPPSGPLDADVVRDIRKWIEMGAPDPRGQESAKPKSTLSVEDIEKGREYWAFRPLQNALPPGSVDSKLVNSDIDRFVLAKLNEMGIEPNQDASPNVLLQRIYYDLIGLPPSLRQRNEFLTQYYQDPNEAVSAVVDRLLDSKQFGERWGRHWLDLARFAESSGKETNVLFPHAWRYRDYVYDSFEKDKPFDQFVLEQIAGDLLPWKNPAERTSNLVATGFLAIGPKILGEKNDRQFMNDIVDEQIDVTSRVFLGTSIACARCHDHKFDPIPQSDYYAMAGMFHSSKIFYGTYRTQPNYQPGKLIQLPWVQPKSFEQPLNPKDLELLASGMSAKWSEFTQIMAERKLGRMNKNTKPFDNRKNYKRLAFARTQMGMMESVAYSHDSSGKPKCFCMGVLDNESPKDASLLVRGEIDQPSKPIPRGVLQVMKSQPLEIPDGESGRLQLANWLTEDASALTARVMANRVWKQLFGRGIVKTTENFGKTGLPPTHPELLEYLAEKFISDGWSTKKLIKRIMISNSYRRSSEFDTANFNMDPENKYIWRAAPRRKDAEVLRDSMLAISGQLNLKRPVGSEVAKIGPGHVAHGKFVGYKGYVLRNLYEQSKESRLRTRGNFGAIFVPSTAGFELNYRSAYLPIVRDQIPRSLEALDFAEASMIIGRRESSHSPDQALYYLNNPLVTKQSRIWARKLIEHSNLIEKQIQKAFEDAFGRTPTRAEVSASRAFIKGFEDGESTNRIQKLTAFCQALFASAEFRIVN